MIKDLPTEIYDICPNTGMPLFPGQSPMTQEEIDEFHRVCEMTEEEYYMYWNEGEDHAQDAMWHESHS